MTPEVHLPGEWAEWNITELIGSGSYGTVYKAERKLDDQVIVSAIKVISVPSSDESDMSVLDLMHGDKEKTYEYYYGVVRDFEREIRAMNSLKGITNIVSIEDYYIEKQDTRIGWNIYLRMEYLTCFSNFWSNHLLKEDDAISLGIDISTALYYCEKAHIIHRDVKPENIFVTRYGNYKLGDFGIARKLDQTLGTYTLRGTYRYMAPEIFHNNPYGTTVDQYSLGLVLYSMMNGNRMPFLSEGQQLYTYKDRQKALQRRMDGEQLPSPSDASPEFAKIILRACEYKPDDRYPSIEQMQEDLEELRRERRLAGKAAKADSTDPLLGSLVPGQEGMDAGNVNGSVSGAAGSLNGSVPGAVGSLSGSVPEAAGSLNGSVPGAAENLNGSVPGAAGNLNGSVPGAAGSLNGSIPGAAGSLNGSIPGAAGNLKGNFSGAAGSLGYEQPLQGNMSGSVIPQGSGAIGYGQRQNSIRPAYGGRRPVNSSYAYGRNYAAASSGTYAGTGEGTSLYRSGSSLRQAYLQTPGGIQVAVQSPASQVHRIRRENVLKNGDPFPGRGDSDLDPLVGSKRRKSRSGLGQSLKGEKGTDSVKSRIRSFFSKKKDNKSARGLVEGLPRSTRSVEKKHRFSLSKYSFGELIAIIVALLMIAAALLLVLYQPIATKPDNVVPEMIRRQEAGTEAGRREEGSPDANDPKPDSQGANSLQANSPQVNNPQADNPQANNPQADNQRANSLEEAGKPAAEDKDVLAGNGI